MSLWNSLENVRNKPEPARQAIAWLIAIIVTAIIVAVWLFIKTFPEATAPAPDTQSPLIILWNYITDL